MITLLLLAGLHCPKTEFVIKGGDPKMNWIDEREIKIVQGQCEYFTGNHNACLIHLTRTADSHYEINAGDCIVLPEYK